MKIFLATLLLSIYASAATKSLVHPANPCEIAKIKAQEIDVIAENISNVNTTKTAEGGPYQPKKFKCLNGKCSIVSEAKTIKKYMPGHENADANGYVYFPNVNLNKEVSAMIKASAELEAANARCN